MKKSSWVLLIFIIILILVGSILIKKNKPVMKDMDPSYINFGEITSIIEYGEDTVISAHFPLFGINKLDSITNNLINLEINKFNNKTKDSTKADKNYKSELNIDYEVFKHSDDILSIRFTILNNIPYYNSSKVKVVTNTYDLNRKKFVKLKDIEKKGLLNEIPITPVSSKDPKDIVPVVAPSREIDSSKPLVALTFDDGPNRNTTIPILDTLKEYDSVATFFVLGNRVMNNEDIIRRMISEGSEVGNHSYNHKQLTTITSSEVKDQINRTQDAVMEVVGSKPKLMRPTYGSYDDLLKSEVDMPMILWSIDTLDWKSKNAEKVSTHVLNNVKDGDIVLMHDIYGSTADAIKIIVPELISRGYELVTVSELYHLRGETLKVGNIYNSSYK